MEPAISVFCENAGSVDPRMSVRISCPIARFSRCFLMISVSSALASIMDFLSSSSATLGSMTFTVSFRERVIPVPVTSFQSLATIWKIPDSPGLMARLETGSSQSTWRDRSVRSSASHLRIDVSCAPPRRSPASFTNSTSRTP